MKQVPTREILQTALQWVEKHPMPIALASTTGQTARELMELAGTQAIRLIVITHDPKRTYKKIRFDKSVREKLIKSGYTFLEDRAPWLPRISISRLFERTFNISSLSKKERSLAKSYGIGGKVCFMIAERAYKTGFIKGNEPILALAGSRTGIDTAFILRITPPGGRPYGIDLIRIIAHPHQKSDFGPISAAN